MMNYRTLLLLSLLGLTACSGGNSDGGSGNEEETNNENNDNGENTAPTATEQTLTVIQNTTKHAITLTGSDDDGDTLTYSLLRRPRKGELEGTAPDITYTPEINFRGEDRLTFKVNDGSEDSTTATVTLNVAPPVNNAAPVAGSQELTTKEDTPIDFSLIGSDANNQTLSPILPTSLDSGSLTRISRLGLTYTPEANFSGKYSFTFQLHDGQLRSNIATIEINITAINDAPTANNLTIGLNQDSTANLILSGSDIEDSQLTYTVTIPPTSGLLSGTAPNLTYTPNSSYIGSDSFDYEASDGELDSSGSVTIAVDAAMPVTPLNDTGITWGGNYPNGNNGSCIGETVSEQDCNDGRDLTLNDDSDGHAGFSFTKLDAAGNDLSASATTWSCVRDSLSGLVWEVKQTVEGLHNTNDRYNWYNTDSLSNGGAAGDDNGQNDTCYGYIPKDGDSYCNTQAYTTRVNTAGLCGANNWRLPTTLELEGLVNYGQVSPTIDTAYFPATKSDSYWSVSSDATRSTNAWYVYFYHGYAFSGRRDVNRYVRLVHN